MEVRAISADGSIVAGEGVGGVPALWTETGGIESFPLPTGYGLFNVSNISGDGTTMVGGVRIGSGLTQRYEAFRWTSSGGYQALGRFSTSYIDWAYANDVSHDGTVVVGTNDTPDGRRAFRWTQATGQVNLGTLGTTNPYYDPFSEANAVSADGSITVGYVTTSADSYYKPFRWTLAGGFDVIGLPPVTVGIPAGGAGAISGDGVVLAGISQTSGDVTSWTWTEDSGFTAVPPGPSGTSALVSAVSFDGTTMVGGQIVWNQPNPGQVIYNAVLWRKTDSGYKISLVKELLEEAGVDMTGWHLRGAWDVSYDGRFLIGAGTDPKGVQRSWYAMLPIPEPAQLLLISVALPLLGSRRCLRSW